MQGAPFILLGAATVRAVAPVNPGVDLQLSGHAHAGQIPDPCLLAQRVAQGVVSGVHEAAPCGEMSR